ncbi:MAG: ABC transporter ATP-binding protein [Hyphomicrobiales bacterium]|nr:ABC transporter ATP-binding protein [Hyphomicrobiales bacterium]
MDDKRSVSLAVADGPQRSGSDRAPLVETIGLTKRFGELVACDEISFDLNAGEIHALLGENGAGKSTLVKMLYGALEPDEGTILWRGVPVRLANPAEARSLGIGMVFQHFSLFESLNVAENILLGLPAGERRRGLADKIRTISHDYGLPLDPDATVHDLSVGERQRVEIVRCLLQEPQLIIMDEPTSVLTPQEADLLFVTLRRLAAEGRAILYITHRLPEVLELAERATILRRGRVVASADPKRESAASLANMMVGAKVGDVERSVMAQRDGEARLQVKDLSAPASGPFSIALKDISLAAHAGEIVCIAGVAGNGQSELFDALSGETRARSNEAICIDGVPCGHLGVTRRRQLGAAFVPEERLGHGAVAELRLSDNVVLTRHATADGLVRSIFVDARTAGDVESRVVGDYDVRIARQDPEARSLSGGNLQKFVVGRELDRRPGVLVVNQPTWGVDAGAASVIRQALIDLAGSGSAVVVISQDLDEIFEIADRIAVISRGRLSPPVKAEDASRESVGLLMGGIGGQSEPSGKAGKPDGRAEIHAA